MVVILSIIFHTYGSRLPGIISSALNQIPAEKRRKDFKARTLSNPLFLFICGGILLILILNGLSFAAIMTGVIERGCPGLVCRHSDIVVAEKTGVDSIMVAVGNEDPSMDWVPPHKRPVFTVVLNGNDVSNQKIVEKQGIAITVDPPQGLQYQRGARVILKGPGVFNNTPYCTVNVTEKYPSKRLLVLLDMNFTRVQS